VCGYMSVYMCVLEWCVWCVFVYVCVGSGIVCVVCTLRGVSSSMS